ncbi:MAG TPA: acylphosphatase [Longimicrobiales bacterium]|nr:acylphosphatase [Longimicrobiales bacterium]
MKHHRIHTVAYGRVQGVGFRDFVRRAARALDLHGYARNLPDGTVQVEAAGDTDALARLRTHLQRGPDFARVDRLEDRPPGVDELPHPFSIR